MEILKKQGISCNCRNSSELSVDLENEDRPPPPSATPMDLIRNPNIRKKFFILAFDWVANAVVYNGLSYNTTNLGVSDYLAFFIGKQSSFVKKLIISYLFHFSNKKIIIIIIISLFERFFMHLKCHASYAFKWTNPSLVEQPKWFTFHERLP